ncbi:MAG: FAD-linked oxidase C-terminal domain-containing protein [Thermodesulfobacteriota bacterium]
MTLSERAFQALRQITGHNYCTRKKEDLVCYAYDATARKYPPDAVVFPASAEEISRILELACREKFIIVPRGSGSGMTGGSLAVNGGVVLVTSRLNRILDIDRDNLVARVEPGVITGDFHAAVERLGLFYPPDPASSAFSTLGGNVAECAGGPRAVKYGVTRDYVLGLKVVLPTGEIIHTGVSTAKGVVGYDLTRLMTGSEGTLGIIAEITLRLLPLPEDIRTMTAVFPSMKSAAQTVSRIIQQGLIPRTIEYMDNNSIRCVETSLNAGLPVDAAAILLLEVDGSPSANREALTRLEEICRDQGAVDIKTAENREAADRLWRARKAVSPALYAFAPDKINEDIVVPRNRIPDMVEMIKRIGDETGLVTASFGHAGDGNIHVNIMLDKSDSRQLQAAEKAVDELFDYTLLLGGTISGEHGIGITKSAYMGKEIGPTEMALMKKIKALFDPFNILNPGKIFSTGK